MPKIATYAAMELVRTIILQSIFWICAENTFQTVLYRSSRRGRYFKPLWTRMYPLLTQSLHTQAHWTLSTEHPLKAGSRKGEGGSLSLPLHPRVGSTEAPVLLSDSLQVIAKAQRVTQDSKKKCCQMVYGTNLPLLSSPRLTELLGMEGAGKKMRLWVGGSLRRVWEPLMQWILLSNKA